ncbi:hypothetical protein GCM10010840_20820 [Deinococcus aerolatus]|uniref:Lipoprotein n=1 Tax=Deinococcus aerolatus TaxID=522487 RepID=A0ABQ2G9W7_9DEIO|nr:hypothetical protein [Deinococcus aerolatus]GGL82888.1 hypothetical protein GCM10010840_20820 [Deinococcus aerolatus]
MPTLHNFVRRTSAVLLTLALLGVPSALARQADALGTQLSAMSGTGLMGSECQQRMGALDLVLREAGYRLVRSQLVDGTMIARWSHPERRTSVLVFAGWQESGNEFSATELTGLMRWNEPLAF